jgi:glycosyltransferase involved in cell wall biosynthesis
MYQRVLCVTGERGVCEPTRYLVRLVRGLRGLGHEVHCFLPEGAGAVGEAVGGQQWWGLGTALGGFLFRKEWLHAATEFQPTVIHACGWAAARPARVLAGALAVPLVASVFETTSWHRLKQVVEVEDKAGGGVPFRLVASHAKLAEELRAPGARPRRLGARYLTGAGRGLAVEVILPGVVALPRQAGGEAEGESPVIGTIAELDGSADVELLLRAVRLVNGEGVRVECAVIGEGPQERRLRRLAHGLGLRTETHFLAALLDPQPVLAEMALVVVLPRRELPVLSILEAQAAGRCVVSGPIPGIDQFVEDGVTGRLLAEASPQALASVIKELLADGEARRRLGEEASRRAARSASLPTMLEAIVLLYNSLTAQARGTA